MARNDGRIPFPIDGGCQAVAFTDSSARTSNPVGNQTRLVLISSTSGAHYVFGDSGVDATTADTHIVAGGEHLVNIGRGQYVAAIRDSAGVSGTLHVSEMGG